MKTRQMLTSSVWFQTVQKKSKQTLLSTVPRKKDVTGQKLITGFWTVTFSHKVDK